VRKQAEAMKEVGVDAQHMKVPSIIHSTICRWLQPIADQDAEVSSQKDVRELTLCITSPGAAPGILRGCCELGWHRHRGMHCVCWSIEACKTRYVCEITAMQVCVDTVRLVAERQPYMHVPHDERHELHTIEFA